MEAKTIIMGAGGTAGGTMGAVSLTALSFAIFPVAPIAAAGFGIGAVGGAISGAFATGKIYDKVAKVHNNIDDVAELTTDGSETKNRGNNDKI